MRIYTLAFSILAHAIVVWVALIAPLVATADLPEPRRSSTFLVVRPVTTVVPDVQRRASRDADRAAQPAIPTAAAPMRPPDSITDAPAGVYVDDGALGIQAGAFGGDVGAAGDPVPPPPVRTPPQPVRVGGVVRPPEKVTHVAPVYPTIARQAKVEGIVILEAVIGEAGTVDEVRVLRSVPLLDAAAIEAVRQWRFTPTELNGQPIPVVMTITVTFALR